MNKSRWMRWAGYLVKLEAKMDAFGILVGNPERKETTRKTKT
jgi:hypothetical protein